MRLRQVIHFKLTKSESLAHLFSKVVESLRQRGCEEPLIVFRMENMPGGRSNACARVTKAFPSLSCFQITEPELTAPKNHCYVLTNRPSASNAIENKPIQTADVDTLELVASGVPKSFPFFLAEFLFVASPLFEDEVNCSAQAVAQVLTATKEPLECAELPNIYLKNSYTPRGRRCKLVVTVEQEALAFELKKVPDFGKPARLIASLGQIGIKRFDLIFSNEELERIDSLSEQSQRFYDEYENTVSNNIQAISFPHDLPDTQEMGMFGLEKVGSLKEDLVEVFRKRAFRYQSKLTARGEYRLQKRTARGNVIDFFVDTGLISENASASLHLYGLGLDCGFYPLPISAEVPRRNQYPILDLEHWRKIVENIAAVVDYLEKEIIPGIDELWGQCPLWYSRWS